jgi:hypothetical protein
MAGEPSKEDMIQNVLSSYQVALNDKGIDEDYLAQKASEALNATVSKTVKLKSWFNRQREVETAKATGKRDINLYVLAWTVICCFFTLVGL